MTIDTQEVLRYIKAQHSLFDAMYSSKVGGADFNEGIMAGLDLVKAFVENYENHEGKTIAQSMGE